MTLDDDRLALIPARGGSKGVPDKNLRTLGGLSLTARAVRCAKESGLFRRIVVSTDSDRIAAEGLAEGGEVIPRPQELASDTADVVDVIDQVLGVLRLEGFVPSSVTLLEPSSPLRTVEIVKRTVAELRFSDAAFTVSPVPSRFHARKQFSLDRESIARPTVSETPPPVRRQELAPTFIKNGAAYAFRTESFLRCRSVLGAAPRAVLIAEPIVNIDTLADLAAAARHLGDG